jgi:protein-tyrosine phosphatase
MEPRAIPPPTGRSYWVIEGLLAAGAYPAGDALERLIGAGISAFVNLTQDTDWYSVDANLERYDPLPADDTVVVRHPIVDLGVPTETAMSGILDEIDRFLAEGRKVYVHCWGGIGRTGIVVGCWLIRHDLAHPADVLDILARLRVADTGAGRHPSPETVEQRAFVRSWRAEL